MGPQKSPELYPRQGFGSNTNLRPPLRALR
jgi:hypothetical protein